MGWTPSNWRAIYIRTKRELQDAGNPREIITMAERRFPVRIRIGVPPGGFGQRHTNMTTWLDENCGADGWAMTPSGVRGVLNDAVSIYFSMQRWRARLSPAGAPGPRSRRKTACSAFVTTSQRRGLGRGCIGRLDLQRNWAASRRRLHPVPWTRNIAASAKCDNTESCPTDPNIGIL
jgi:hypothetical protein